MQAVAAHAGLRSESSMCFGHAFGWSQAIPACMGAALKGLVLDSMDPILVSWLVQAGANAA
jgi:hypothetical protein